MYGKHEMSIRFVPVNMRGFVVSTGTDWAEYKQKNPRVIRFMCDSICAYTTQSTPFD